MERLGTGAAAVTTIAPIEQAQIGLARVAKREEPMPMPIVYTSLARDSLLIFINIIIKVPIPITFPLGVVLLSFVKYHSH